MIFVVFLFKELNAKFAAMFSGSTLSLYPKFFLLMSQTMLPGHSKLKAKLSLQSKVFRWLLVIIFLFIDLSCEPATRYPTDCP